jgi:hypothetical protein
MKAKTAIILFYLAALIVGGCIPSLHPLYTDETLIFEEKLIGKWTGGDNEIWQFSKANEKEYELRIVKDEKEGRFEAHLLELDGKMYLDLYPGENESMENMNDYYKLHLVAAHTFLWINLTEPNLQLNWFMQKLLEDDPNLLRHETINKDQIILTASTEELQRFVIENADKIDPNGAEFIRMEQLFAEEDIIFEEKLLGAWESNNCGKISFKNNGEDIYYDITYTDNNKDERKFKAIAFRIEDVTLLAVYYSEPTDNEIECGQELIPDMFAAVEQIEPTLLLNKLDYEQAREIISSGKLPVEPDKQYDFEGSRIDSH